ncbi:MAG: hypothetical protein E6I80_15345 [Chloroflexi bacterium]|nr:MAG: hypothetical protein E6I80_15345 [Chloroflexota bacterium]
MSPPDPSAACAMRGIAGPTLPRLTARVNPIISDHPSAARTMRSTATCIVGLTLAGWAVVGRQGYGR